MKKKKNLGMNIIERPLEQIIPYERNAKVHDEKQIAQVAASIKEFGWAQPIVVDKNGVIIVGHARLLAAQRLKLETAPVLVLDLSEEKAKTYRLSDNKLNESSWDMNLVISELKELSLEMVELTGFDSDLLIDPDEQDDVVPGVPKVVQSKLGDLYELGPHRILCGDSTSKADVANLMGKAKADMVFIDPPYNVDYHGTGKNTSTGIMGDDLPDAEFFDFLCDAFQRLSEIVKRGAGMYVFHSPRTQRLFEMALEQKGFEIKNQIIWNKPHAGLGMGDFRQKHEPMFYCYVKGEKAQFYGDHTNTTVLDLHKSEEALAAWAKREKKLESEGKTTIWTMKREPVGDYVHPTQKPVELIGYALANSSKKGDIVADLFLGSGATLIAAQKFGRECYGAELDPRFVDVIVQRYCEYVQDNEILKNGKRITWTPV